MVTVAQARKNKLASTAGLKTSTAGVPALSFNPSMEIGPYKPEEIITTQEHMVRYLGLLVEANKDEDDKSPELDAKQILAAWGQIDQEQEPLDRDQAFLDYVATLKSSKREPLTEAQRRDLRDNNTMWAYAEQCGRMASKELEAAIEESIDGKKLWDGGPIVIEAELVKVYGKDMTGWPLIGSRLTGKTNRKGESTDNVPAGYNGPTDYFKATVNSEEIVVRWLQGFVEAMPHVSQLLTLRATGKAILAGNQLATIPAPFNKYVPTETNGVKEKDTPKIQGIIDDLSGDISKHINRIGNAISFYQAKQLIKEYLSDKVDFELVDGTPEAARKRTKPIQMSYTIDRDGKTKWVEESKPISLSTFIRYGKNAAKCKEMKGGLSVLMEISKAKKQPKPVEGPGSGTKAAANKIENVDQFLNNLDVLYDYAAHHEGQIKARCSDQRQGAEFCYALIQAYNALESVIAADDSSEGLIRKRANLWDQQQLAGRAAEDAVKLAQLKNKAA